MTLNHGCSALQGEHKNSICSGWSENIMTKEGLSPTPAMGAHERKDRRENLLLAEALRLTLSPTPPCRNASRCPQ